MIKDAEDIRFTQKHDEHNIALQKIIDQLEELTNDQLEPSNENIFNLLKANTDALLFLCKERRRDRARREAELKAQGKLP